VVEPPRVTSTQQPATGQTTHDDRWLVEHHPVAVKAEVLLTSREEDVLRLLAAGAPNKAIGYALSLSESSVREYVKRILWKMGAKNRTEAAVLALRKGLVL
jgi:DNA-binding NarL/FixJ family response regulator